MNSNQAITTKDWNLSLRRFRDTLTGRLCTVYQIVPDDKLPSMAADAERMPALIETEADEMILATFRQFAAEWPRLLPGEAVEIRFLDESMPQHHAYRNLSDLVVIPT